jgi:hypothetical protein
MSLAPFSLVQRTTGIETYVLVTGYVNEEANFAPVKITPIMRISLKDVDGLNSIGTRSWCRWMQAMSGCTEVWLEYCPVLFVKAFNQVMGSLLPNTIVQSFYVPYYSDETDEAQEVLYENGKDFNLNGSFKLKEIKDSKGKPMEPDVVLEPYLAFLKTRAKSI